MKSLSIQKALLRFCFDGFEIKKSFIWKIPSSVSFFLIPPQFLARSGPSAPSPGLLPSSKACFLLQSTYRPSSTTPYQSQGKSPVRQPSTPLRPSRKPGPRGAPLSLGSLSNATELVELQAKGVLFALHPKFIMPKVK